jgi:hypothetical protein
MISIDIADQREFQWIVDKFGRSNIILQVNTVIFTLEEDATVFKLTWPGSFNNGIYWLSSPEMSTGMFYCPYIPLMKI